MANHTDECSTCEDLLAVREWLTDEETRQLSAHLAACPACRRREAALSALAVEFAPPDLADHRDPALTERIMAATTKVAQAEAKPQSSPLVPALAALIVLLLIITTSLMPGGPAFSAAWQEISTPITDTVSGLGNDLTGTWSDLAAAAGEGLAGTGLSLGWLLSAMAAGCLVVVVGCRRELLSSFTAIVHTERKPR